MSHRKKIYVIPTPHGKKKYTTKDIAALHFLTNIPMKANFLAEEDNPFSLVFACFSSSLFVANFLLFFSRFYFPSPFQRMQPTMDYVLLDPDQEESGKHDILLKVIHMHLFITLNCLFYVMICVFVFVFLMLERFDFLINLLSAAGFCWT